MKKALVFTYSLVCYAIFLATFLYLIAFVWDLPVPATVNHGETGPVAAAIAVNVLLAGLFALQHLVMARAGFKRWWTRIVPEPMERSTFVLATCIVFGLIFYFWRPLPGELWSLQGPARIAVLALSSIGWLTVLYTTFLINHFHLFGLSQGWAFLRGKAAPEPQFQTPTLYRVSRHPMMVGMLLALWATPRMTGGHLLLAVGMTAFVLVALRFEERDLTRLFGATYREYQRQVPMLLPVPGKSFQGASAAEAS